MSDTSNKTLGFVAKHRDKLTLLGVFIVVVVVIVAVVLYWTRKKNKASKEEKKETEK